MPGMLDQLVDVMKEQTERHKELHGLSLEEKDAIIKNDIDALQNLVNLKNMVISQNNRLEKQRVSLVKDIADVMGNKNTDLSLADLIEIIEIADDKEKLREAGNALRAAVTQLKEINDVNKSLLESSIEFVEYSLNALRSTISPEHPEFPIRPSTGGDSPSGKFDTMR